MATVILIACICFLFGAVIGSFLAVCSFRIPMGKYEPTRPGVKQLDKPVSLTKPARSFCPECEHPLEWWQLIPIVSWCALRGRCAHCGAPVSFRYVIIELLTASLAVLCFLRLGPTPEALALFIFMCLLVVITFIDLDYMIIPDVITYPATFAGLMIGLVNYFTRQPLGALLGFPFVQSPFDSLMGLLMGPGMLLSVWWLYFKIRKREGLGLGDVKLLAMVGATFGAECAWFTIFAGSLTGAFIGLATLLIRRDALSTYIPFGPYLALGTTLFLFQAHEMLFALLGQPSTITWWIRGIS